MSEEQTPEEFYKNFKNFIFNSIINSIDINYQGDPLDKIIEKLVMYIKDFSINNLSIHLPELMGWSFLLGMQLMAIYNNKEKAKEELRERLEKEKDYERGVI